MTEPDSRSELPADDQLRQYYNHSGDHNEPESPAGIGIPAWLRYSLIIVITTLWVASIIADFLVKSYDPPATLNYIIFAVIPPALLGTQVSNALQSRKARLNE